MATSLALSITQNSRNVNANTSNVTVKATLSWTYGTHNLTGECYGSLVIDGTTYKFTNVVFNSGQTTSGSQVVMTKTVNVSHDADGTKKLNCSASFYTGISGAATKTASASKTLTSIPRISSLTVSNGTLGTNLSLTITKQSSSFTHTITYSCGTASGTIVSKTSATNVTWSASTGNTVALSSQNTSGTSVSVVFTISTYNGTSLLGSSKKTISMAIPASVKPSCTISVVDASGYESTYNGLIKGMSRLKISVIPTVAYGSTISTYDVSVGTTRYLSSDFTTGLLNTDGELNITATVTDKRGRTSSVAIVTKMVLDYSNPVVTKLSVRRVNQNGTENAQGEYVQVKFSSKVSSLNNNNSASYSLKYKKSSEDDTSYTQVSLTSYADVFVVVDGTAIFPADTGSSYDVELTATDNFKSSSRNTSASTAFTLMNWNAAGNGIGIGKVSEEPNLLDIALATKFNGNVRGNVFGLYGLPDIPENSDLNSYKDTGCWAVKSNSIAATITNIPVECAGRLEISSANGTELGENEYVYRRQRFIPYRITDPVWERDITRDPSNVWSYDTWTATTLSSSRSSLVYKDQTVLWEGGYYMTETQTASLSGAVSDQPTGIVLVFSRYYDGTAYNDNFNSFFVPKIFVSKKSGYGSGYTMFDSTFGKACNKYLYIHDTKISGNANNNKTGTGTTGIEYANNRFVLRYVLGV